MRTRVHRAAKSSATAAAACFLMIACGSKQIDSALPAGTAPTRTEVIQALAANEHTLVAGTQTGAILASADYGKSWRRQTLGHVSVIGIASCPDESFVAIDFYRTVWQGSADGTKWTSTAMKSDWTPLAVVCDANSTWWIAGTNASIASSADRGATWKVTSLGEDLHLTALQFPSPTLGVAVGEFGTVAISQDGGATWTRLNKISEDFYPYSLLFVDVNTGYVSGVAGQTLVTHDAGKNWTPIINPTGLSLYKLVAIRGQVFAVGAVGVLAEIENGNWKRVVYPDARPSFIGAAAALGGERLAMGGPGGLIRVWALPNIAATGAP